jgi:hypothetical protein
VAFSGCASTSDEGLTPLGTDAEEIQVDNNPAGLSGVTVA